MSRKKSTKNKKKVQRVTSQREFLELTRKAPLDHQETLRENCIDCLCTKIRCTNLLCPSYPVRAYKWTVSSAETKALHASFEERRKAEIEYLKSSTKIPKSTGRTQLLRHLKGHKLTYKQIILARCAKCQLAYINGKKDCEDDDCLFYLYMPYKGKKE